MRLAGRPEAVRRHVLAPLRWLPATVAVVLGAYAMEAAWVSGQNRSFAGGYTVEARVDDADDDPGDPRVPITYRNPLTGETEASLQVPGGRRRPRAGETVTVEVDRADPHDVALRGHRVPAPVVWPYMLLAAVPVVAWGLRRWGVWRVERLAARPGPSFLLLGVIDARVRPLPRLRPARQADLHLFPLDAAPGQRPLCSVPLLATRGIPMVAQGVEVEVKGSVRPFGRLALRVDAAMLWHRGRALAVSSRRERPPTVGRPPAFTPVPVPVPGAGDGVDPPRRPRASRAPEDASAPHAPALRPVRSWLAHGLVPLGLLTAGCLLGTGATLVTIHNRDAARRLVRDGTDVVVTVTGDDAYTLSAPVEYRLPGEGTGTGGERGSGSGGDRVISARVPVDRSVRAGEGDRFPAVVDPASPQHVRLLAVPYDPVLPLVWAWAPAVVSLLWLRRSRRWRRASLGLLGQACEGDGMWVEVDAWVVALGRGVRPWVDLAIAHPASPAPSCLVRLAGDAESSTWRRIDPAQPVRRLWLAGVPGAGEAVLLRAGDAVVVPAGPAAAVDRGDGYVPRPRSVAVAGWLTSRHGEVAGGGRRG